MMPKNKFQTQSGQTIVETVVAIFVMVMGVTSALGLANYAFSTSTNISKQLIGMGLAREGMEAIKNMRDTNWLRGGAPSNSCYNFSTGSLDATCYTNWLNPGTAGSYNFGDVEYTSNSNRSFTLVFSPQDNVTPGSSGQYWEVKRVSGQAKFGLNFDTNASTGPKSGGYYKPDNTNPSASGYYRKMSFRYEGASNLSASGPFGVYTAADPYREATTGPRIRVVVEVWWKDKGCPDPSVFNYDAPNRGSCRIRLEEYLTNWKNY